MTVAPWSGSVWTVYRLGSDALNGWQVGGGGFGSSSRWIDDQNRGKVPSYFIWNAMVGYFQPKWDVQFNVANIFDKKYYVGGYQNNPNRVLPGQPTHRAAHAAVPIQLTGVRAAAPAPRKAAGQCSSTSSRSSHPSRRRSSRAMRRAQGWVDGNVTSGHQSAQAKYNEQLPEDSPLAQELGRDDPRGARAQRAVHVGGAAEAGVSAALQPLRRRDELSATTSTARSACTPHRARACAPTCPRRCS